MPTTVSWCQTESVANSPLTDPCLAGELPLCLFECTELRYLKLDSNRLTGPIPDALGDLSRLRLLSLVRARVHHAAYTGAKLD